MTRPRGRRLARRRVRRLRRGPARCGASSRRRGGGPVLDVGAGTGRVALDLARRGVEVVALDVERDLLAALRDRAAAEGLDRRDRRRADARALRSRRAASRWCVAPMQTVQLLGGRAGRARSWPRARAPPARPAACSASRSPTRWRASTTEHDEPPLPDLREVDGVRYAQPAGRGARPATARRDRPRAPGRRAATARGSTSADVIELDRVDAGDARRRGARRGLEPRGARRIPATDDYVGSTVVLLRA